MMPFVQYKQWMIERYGEPLFRIPVQIASSCPHGRCAFCSEQGAKAQQTQQQIDPLEQAEEAIRFAKRRYRARKFMLYIQAFTADLTDPEQQRIIFQTLEKFDFEAISIGTRPDCLSETAMTFLEKLKSHFPIPLEVWVELGVQTSNDEALKQIHRGHDWACSKKAILELAERGIHVAPHVIIGLPGETSEHWNRTAEELAELPISGIKIHNLHVVEGTALAENPPPVMNHWDYAEALMNFLRRIPADIPVMRICTDTPDDELIAPHWHLQKGQFLDYVLQQMEMREITQGDLVETGNWKLETGMEPVTTDDGSITFFSNDWKEHYHDKAGAKLEAQKKYIEPSNLRVKLNTSDLKLLDVCFGLGVNSLAALDVAADAPHRLEITALEMDKRVVRAAAEQPDSRSVLSEILTNSSFITHHSSLSLLWGDARYRIHQLPDSSFDLIYHDPFSSQHCPELWTVEFFEQLMRVIRPDGLLLTYASAAPARGAMREAGFQIAETVPGRPMGNGTIASPSGLLDVFPNIGKLDERRSIPYRDPHLCYPAKVILRNRQTLIETDRNNDE